MREPLIYAASWLINPDLPPVAGGAILVSEGIIADIGTLKDLKARHSVPVIDYPDSAIVPGFVNAHTHLALTHFPSWRLRFNPDSHPAGFTDWLIHIVKVLRGLSLDDYIHSASEGMRMCLESGTTSVGEILVNPAMVNLYHESSLAGRLYFEVLGHSQTRFMDKLNSAVSAATSCSEGAMTTGLSPHTPYTIGEEFFGTITDAAASHNLPMAIHLSESAEESNFIFDSSGTMATDFYPFVGWEPYLSAPRRCTSSELLDRYGLLTPSTLAVHCVHLNLADARILKERGVSIALCPRSNDCLDVGRAPVGLFMKLGIPLALGTDSLASNNSLSLWDEMRYALDVFPQHLAPADLFRMVTSGGASALMISSTSGLLGVRRRADFQVIGNIGTGEDGVVERIVHSGKVQVVYTGGRRFTGVTHQHTSSCKTQ